MVEAVQEALGRLGIDDEVVADVARDFDLEATAPAGPAPGGRAEAAPNVHRFRPADRPSAAGSSKGIVRRLSERLRESR